MHHYEVLLRPIVTEKADVLTEQHNQYIFEVASGANKHQIRDAIEAIFHVTVAEVRTAVIPGKTRRWGRHVSRLPSWKKAIVTVASGNRIDVFE